MKLKQALTGMAALACMTAAHAQTANTFYVTTGWFHFMPQDSSDPLKVTNVGGSPVNITIPNTGAGIDDSDTIGLSLGYFITDHISTELELGIPPKFDLNGKGTFEQFGKIGSAKLWSPALLFKYNFNDAQAKFRPYVGLGVTRVWFTDAKITNGQFEQGVLNGPTSVSTDRSWSPVFNIGFNYAFTKHWFAGLSVSYIPVSVKATLNTARSTPVGTLNATSETKIKLNPVVTYVKVGYAF
ncbi:OmpW/AlkL family protein [Paraburkholderia kururiensis]|uniref:OmpW family outer membrane protein n=1 Tax=Paraburkholderia kururiensis TaxID=984307 RepID=A0ABZ0WF33_9BURK|nr:OmpW family outer membrane protein [Paraburkholderia kururiensis]WQD75937.1 OmpW family outer membrane protein [Paraburkholderia kururiensis]